MATKKPKLPTGPPARMNLVTTQVRADVQQGEDRVAEDAFTHGNPKEWNAMDVLDSVYRAAYQSSQASGRGKEANEAKGRATQLICETLLGVCSVELDDEWMHDSNGIQLSPREARQTFANHVYSTGFRATTSAAAGRWDDRDRSHPTREKQISSAAALWSGKRQDWANALTLYNKKPAVIQAILEPNRRNISKDGNAGKTVSFDSRAKDMTAKIDVEAKKQCTNWDETISALQKAQGNVTTYSKQRNDMRAEVTSAYALDVVTRDKDTATAWNQDLQNVIDGNDEVA
jgi:hypothetical protein